MCAICSQHRDRPRPHYWWKPILNVSNKLANMTFCWKLYGLTLVSCIFHLWNFDKSNCRHADIAGKTLENFSRSFSFIFIGFVRRINFSNLHLTVRKANNLCLVILSLCWYSQPYDLLIEITSHSNSNFMKAHNNNQSKNVNLL